MTVEDSVPGDLMASGAVVSVTAPVAGDLLSAGASVSASGPVAGSLRAAGAKVTLAGPVGHNVTLAGGSVRVAPTAEVEGNLYLAGGEVVIEGTVLGSVRASAGTVRILGSVTGPVELDADRVVVGPGAHLAAGLTHSSPKPAEVAAGARIDGTISYRPTAGTLTSWVNRILKIVTFLFTGAVIVALFPRTFEGLRDTLRERPWLTMGLGLAALVVVPLGLILLAITLLGLPLALVGAALFAGALYVARTVAAVWLGDRLLGGGPGRGARVTAFLLGGVIVLLAGLLPWIGSVVTFAATLAGLGAAAGLAKRAWRRGRVAG
ncbi:MAG: polymer-forming cytoskeletal protein [Gemmatimonadales bacterium]